MKDVCDRLYEIAGVRPSRTWLNSYRASQHSFQQQNLNSADVILHQVLHHDLRDVVREMGETVAEPNTCAHAQQLRQLVRSLQPGSNNLSNSPMTATLPGAFRLMIQVEEIVDVAQNQESRLSGGRGQQRCLKLCISDGYPVPAVSDANNSGQQQVMFAMEMWPIPNLSIQSKAGIKILLHGPIDIRWGFLLLHEGNALVLGGNVHHLAKLQAKALEEAKKQAGVGVDPTLKALVWNPLTGAERDEDEGEQESGDVIVEQPLPPMRPQGPTMPVFNPTALPNRPPLTHTSTLQQQTRRRRLAVSPAPAPTNITRPGQHTASPPLPRQPFEAASHASANSRQQAARAQSINPYVRNTPMPISANGGNSISCQTGLTTTAGAATPRHPLVAGTPSTGQNSSQISSIEINQPAADADVNMKDVSEAETATDPTTRPYQERPSAPAQSSNGNTTNQSIPSSPSGQNDGSKVKLSFEELRDLLTNARNNEELYRQTFEKVFVVRMKQCEPHHHFDIEKVKKTDRKKGDKKKDKKYFYAIHAKFDSAPGGGRITCAISGDFLEPHFRVPAAEMRNINKTDKERGSRAVNEGGQRAKTVCYQMATWEATLYHSPDDFFLPTTNSSPLDGKRPILMLRSRFEN